MPVSTERDGDIPANGALWSLADQHGSSPDELLQRHAIRPKCIDRMEQELTGSQRHQEFVTAEDSRFQPLIHNFCIERHSHSGVSDKPMRRERLIPG